MGFMVFFWFLAPCSAASPDRNGVTAPESATASPARRGSWSWHGWTPSLSLSLGFMSMAGEGEGTFTESSGDDFRPPYSGEGRLTSPLARVSLELRTPDLDFLPASPSLFGSVDYISMFSPSQKVAGVGDGSRLVIPANGLNLPEDVISGQGRRIDVEADDHAVGATFGVSIPVEIWGLRMRVMPGVSYMRQVIVVEGKVLDAYKPSSLGRDFRTIRLTGDDKLRLNGVGPSFALEFDAGRIGPAWLSVFVDTAGFKSLGNRDLDFSDERTYTDFIGTETYASRWRYEADEWFYRVDAGVRIHLADGTD